MIGADYSRQRQPRRLSPIRHRWRLIALTVALALVIAYGVVSTVAEQYRATAEILVTPVSAGGSSDTFFGINVLRDPDRSIYVVGRLASTQRVASLVRRRLHTSVPVHELLTRINVVPAQQSSLVLVTGKGSSPGRAAALANAFADAVVSVRNAAFRRSVEEAVADTQQALHAPQKRSAAEKIELEQRLANLRAQVGAPDPSLSVFSRAVKPVSAASPRPRLVLAVTLVAALLLGVAVAFVVEAYDPRIVDDDQVDERLPLLASIPRLRRRQAREYLAGGGRLPAGSWEAYRRLRNSVVDGSDAIRTVLVTSATAGEGKTMTAVNLSLVLAASGRRVVLIDGNLRRPGVAAALGLPAEIAGLGPLLEGHVAVEDVLVAAPGGGDRLRAIAAGPGDSVDLVDGRSVSSILQRLKPYADVIVVDSPALTEYADSVAWASVVDAVVVAVRVGVSRSDKLDELHRVLRQHSIRLAGTVVTGRRRARGPLEIAPYGAGAMAAASEAPATALAEVARR